MIRAGTLGVAAAALVLAACADPVAPPVDTAEPGINTATARGGAQKGYRYEGCGETYGTCATIVLGAEQIGENEWRFRGYIENRSFQAQGAFRNSLLLFASTADGFGNLWDGYSEYDCGGCNFEAGTPGPSVIFASFTGAFDQRCASNRACRSLMLEDFVDEGPAELPYAFPVTVEFNYLRGRVWFDRVVFLSSWDAEQPLLVSQFFVGGTAVTDGVDGGIETYELAYSGRAPLQVPGGLIAREVVQRTSDQAARHAARAAATLRRAYDHREGLVR